METGRGEHIFKFEEKKQRLMIKYINDLTWICPFIKMYNFEQRNVYEFQISISIIVFGSCYNMVFG